MSKYRNFSKLFLGSILGQVIALALYPFISRVYTPEDFSRFGFIFSLTTIISVFATGQFHSAVMNPESEDEARGLVGLATCFVTVFSIFTFIVLFFLNPSICIVGVYLFFYSLFEIERMYLIRLKAYNTSAVVQFSFRLFGNGGKLFSFFVQLNSMGLVLSELVALITVVIYGFCKNYYNFKFDVKLMKKFISFPIFHSSTMALNLMISDFPILFWASKYDAAGIGYFVMGQKLLLVPAAVASQALQNSTVHQLIESKLPLKQFIKSMALTVGIGFAGICFFYLLGGHFIGLLLGPRWMGGILVFELLSILLVTRLLNALVQAIYVLKNSSKVLFSVRLLQLGGLFLMNQYNLDFYDSLKLYIMIELIIEFALASWAAFIIKPPYVFRRTV